jgi:hypothetical protein
MVYGSTISLNDSYTDHIPKAAFSLDEVKYTVPYFDKYDVICGHEAFHKRQQRRLLENMQGKTEKGGAHVPRKRPCDA